MSRLRTFLQRLEQKDGGSIGQAALLLAVASVASRILGVLRDRLLATTFGAGLELDAYYAAFRLPDTLYNLVIIGALSAGFLPLLAELKAKKGAESSMRFASLVFGWFAVALIALAVIGSLFAPQIVPLMVTGFDGERLALTVRLTRWLFLSPFLLGVSAIFGGVLQSARKTLAFAFAPVVYNIGILFGIVALVPLLGVLGVVVGVLLGAALHALLQYRGAFRLGLRWPEQLVWTPDLRRLFVLTAPRLASLGAAQISLVLLLGFASVLPEGSVAVFQLGNNLQSFPLGVIGISFALAAFPLLSDAAGNGDWQAYHDVLGETGRRIVYFLLPVSLLFVLLRAQLVRLILGDGAFNWDATIATAQVVGWMSISLVFQALAPLLARAFYALQSTWTPFIVTGITEALMILAAFFLRSNFGIAGLAMAFSGAAILQVVLLWLALRRRAGAASERSFLRLVVCSLVASVPALVAAAGLRQVVGTVFPLHTVWQVALQFGVSAGGAGVVYLGVTQMMHLAEAEVLWRRIRSLTGRRASI